VVGLVVAGFWAGAPLGVAIFGRLWNSPGIFGFWLLLSE
jgi:hypothetical protein